MKFIVTAGGQGKKLWPYSTLTKPKHFQNITNGESPFQKAVNTLMTAYSLNDIYISTKKRYVGTVLQQVPQLGIRNLIVEPDIQKDRGPAEGLAFLKLSMLHPNEPFMIIQADNLREPAENFLKMTAGADKLVTRDRKFISGGIKATYPVLGVDYIKLGAQATIETDLEIYKCKEFIWRSDDHAKTKDLIQDFHVAVHSNHNCWFPELMLEAYAKYRPDWYAGLMEIKGIMGTPDEEAKLLEIYSKMESGATELVTKFLWDDSYIILLPFKWTDVGTWGSLYEFVAKDDEVFTTGKVVYKDSRNSLVRSANPDKLTAIYGIDNLVVVDTDKVLLILPKDQTEKISELLAQISDENHTEYL